MNDRHAENALKIADYLENRLGSAGEESFIRELGEDEELRRQYEEELLIRAILGSEGLAGEGVEGMGLAGGGDMGDGWVSEGGEGGGLWQPADEHLRLVTEILEKDRAVRKPGAGIALFGRGGMVAAAFLVIISGMVLYIRIGQRKVEEGSVRGVTDTGMAGRGEVAGGTASGGNVAEGRGKVSADSVYARYYRPYSSEGDPVEISLYYQDYKRGNYNKVLGAKEEDYQVMGKDKREKVVKGYMHLYKGLSYLATSKGREAIAELEAAAADSRPGDALYDAARWYLALALLKRKDLYPEHVQAEAAAIAHQIANTQSRYKLQAEELILALGL